MKNYWIAAIILFLMISSACDLNPSPEPAYPTLTFLPSPVPTDTETTAPQTSILITVTPTTMPTLPATQTPIPLVLPTATPVYETYQPITIENARAAQIVYTFASSSDSTALYDLEFSPLGGLLAAVNNLGELQMWRFPKAGTRISMQGYQLDVLSDSEGPIREVAFSPDGKTIASGGASGSPVLRDSATGAILLRQVTGVKVDDLVYSPDNSIIAIAGHKWEDGESKYVIQLWSVSDIKLVATLAGYPGWWDAVCSLTISSDSAVLAAGFCDYHMMAWDLKNGYQSLGKVTGQYAFECYSHCPFPTNSIAFMPNSTILASGTDNPGIPLIDIYTRRLSLQMDTIRPIEREGDIVATSAHGVTDVAFSPDGTILAIAAGQEIQLRSTKTNELLKFFETPGESYVTEISFSPDGLLIAVASYGGNIYVIGVND